MVETRLTKGIGGEDLRLVDEIFTALTGTFVPL